MMPDVKSFVSEPRYIRERLKYAPRKTAFVQAVIDGRAEIDEALIPALAEISGLSIHYLLYGEEPKESAIFRTPPRKED